ncbi:MAG: type II secretion system minor pseudopilin GspK [Pseudomonadota bacterium]
MKRKRQAGVAVITALLLTTLAVTIVASLFWQQQVQVRSMENQRLHLQTKWILRGALDWARLVLRQDGYDHPFATTLNDVWNTPLAETRLDQYIERERVQGETFDATLSGSVVDATSRYNLLNLSRGRVLDPKQVLIFQRLLSNLQLDPGLATRAAEALQAAQTKETPAGMPIEASAGSTAPLEFTMADDLLTVPGFTQDVVAKLHEHVIVLPERTPVNVNTASAEVLAAVVGFSVSEANALAAARKTASFTSKADFKARLQGPAPDDTTFDVKSEYFLVQSRVRLDRAALDAEALVSRKLGGNTVTNLVWIRQI